VTEHSRILECRASKVSESRSGEVIESHRSLQMRGQEIRHSRRPSTLEDQWRVALKVLKPGGPE
jgi:hypothetical protein